MGGLKGKPLGRAPLWRLLLRLCLFNLVLVPCPFYGQQGLKKLTAQEYGLWGTLNGIRASEDLSWVSYSMSYESGGDTLFLQQAGSARRLAFPGGARSRFKGNCFAVVGSDKVLQLRSLSTGKVFSVPGALQYAFAGKYLVVQKAAGKEAAGLLIFDRGGRLLKSIENAEAFSVSPGGSEVAFCFSGPQAAGLGLIDKNLNEILLWTGGKVENIIWDPNGQSLAFAAAGKQAAFFWYGLREKKVYGLAPAAIPLPQGKSIGSFSFALRSVSAGGQRVGFLMQENGPPSVQGQGGPEIWKAADVNLFPLRASNGTSQVGVWSPHLGKCAMAGAKHEAVKLLDPGHQYALTADVAPYSPTAKFDADADYYLTDLKTGKKKRLFSKYPGEGEAWSVAPGGLYYTYFSGGDWWAYSVATGRHRNLTAGLQAHFEDEGFDRTGAVPPYGCAGFSADGASLLLYDAFDLWEVSLDGKSRRRLTAGREKQLVFRLVSPLGSNEVNGAYYLDNKVLFDLNKELLLRAETPDYSKSGCYSLKLPAAEKPLIMKGKWLDGFVKSAAGGNFLWVEQDADAPPAIKAFSAKANKERLVFQSNAQGKDFGKSQSRLVAYLDSAGTKLNGVLFYPCGYDPSLKYPMVVHIYERQSSSLHRYENPSLYDSTGFNRLHFAANGYFVFYPDIAYRLGSPAASALECVLAGTKAALAAASVDSSNIGLIGHSFGGYEVNYIVTQANIFKTAVSGSGISDCISFCLGYSENYARPHFWRFESHQQRIPQLLFDNWQAYLDNSPIYHLKNARIPLLLWTGTDDRQIAATQTMEFYLALRRLGKQAVMLRYPKEGHVLTNPATRKTFPIKY